MRGLQGTGMGRNRRLVATVAPESAGSVSVIFDDVLPRLRDGIDTF